MMRKVLIIILCVFPCILLAQEQEAAISKWATELSADGWKVHAGSPSVEEQLYGAFAYSAYNDTNDPLNDVYYATGHSEYSCVIDMLIQYAKRDMSDWYDEFERSWHNNNLLISLDILGELTYAESAYRVYTSYRNNGNSVSMVEVSDINADFEFNYQNAIIPLVRLYRKKDNKREEMLIAAFTEEFLENRRVPIPVFDHFGSCKTIEVKNLKDKNEKEQESVEEIINATHAVQSIDILHYQIRSLQERMATDADYMSEKYLEGLLSEDRVKMRIQAYYKVEE